MSTTLIFVRHGESEGNKTSIFTGSLNVSLTKTGKAQGERTAMFLEKYPVDAIYSSDLDRAVDTASYIAKRKNIPVVTSKNLREIDGGDFEGIPFDAIKERFPKEFEMWQNNMGDCRCPNGESVQELAKRVNDEVKQIAENHKGQTVVITTHGTPIRAMSTVWHKKNITDIRDFPWVKNASVTIVNYDDMNNPYIELYDGHEHLMDMLTVLPSTI